MSWTTSISAVFFPTPLNFESAAASPETMRSASACGVVSERMRCAVLGPTPLTPISARKISRSVASANPKREISSSLTSIQVGIVTFDPISEKRLDAGRETWSVNPMPLTSTTREVGVRSIRVPVSWEIMREK